MSEVEGDGDSLGGDVFGRGEKSDVVGISLGVLGGASHRLGDATEGVAQSVGGQVVVGIVGVGGSAHGRRTCSITRVAAQRAAEGAKGAT